MEKHSFTAEQLEAARAAKSPGELMERAKEQGVELTLEQVGNFLQAPTGELSDEELQNAAGGGCGGDDPNPQNPHMKAAAAMDGRTVLIPSLCKCTTSGNLRTMYAREKRIVNNGPDEYRDAKCYRCGKVLGNINTWGIPVS